MYNFTYVSSVERHHLLMIKGTQEMHNNNKKQQHTTNNKKNSFEDHNLIYGIYSSLEIIYQMDNLLSKHHINLNSHVFLH